jgi:hypothetical protein
MDCLMGRRSRRRAREAAAQNPDATAAAPDVPELIITAGLAAATAAVPGPGQETGEDDS